MPGWAATEESTLLPPPNSPVSNSTPSVGTSVIPKIASPKQRSIIPACICIDMVNRWLDREGHSKYIFQYVQVRYLRHIEKER